jgi:hypothetical protein
MAERYSPRHIVNTEIVISDKAVDTTNPAVGISAGTWVSRPEIVDSILRTSVDGK